MYKSVTRHGRIEAIAQTTDQQITSKLKFIFTDFQPNANRMVVPQTEADSIMSSALFMPVKINFDDGPGGHPQSAPVGTIISMVMENEQIIAESLLWDLEFPEVSDWIKTMWAEKKDVNFSWELLYNPEASAEDTDGNLVLKDTKVRGITIVDNPAYEGRTRLLSVAEKKMELEAQIADLSAKLDTLISRIPVVVEAELEAVVSDINQLTVTQEELDELTQLRGFKIEYDKAVARAELIARRKSALTEAGINFDDAAFDERSDSILAMDDAIFNRYVQDLALVSKRPVPNEATSSKDDTLIPDPVTSFRGTNGISVAAIAAELKKNRS